MNKYWLLILTVSTIAISIASCSNSTNAIQLQKDKTQIDKINTVAVANSAFSYDDYATVLKTYVNDNGLVDYEGLQANREQLDRFNQSLSMVTPDLYNIWSDREKIAFWFNAYNSLTLQSIIDQQPLTKSIRDISGVWNRRKFEVAGKSKTLDNIEHDTLRKDFNEPRLHVALVCAAMSCPPLRNEPYLPEQLDAQLDDQVRKFIVSPHGFKIDRQQGRVYLSSIFKWYGQDWLQNYSVDNKFAGNKKQKAVINFLSQYLTPEAIQYLARGKYQVKYLDYDWSLNKQL